MLFVGERKVLMDFRKKNDMICILKSILEIVGEWIKGRWRLRVERVHGCEL